MKKKIDALSKMIGNTPLLAIKIKYKEMLQTIYAKAEYYNLTGSIKDRMAYKIITSAYESGELKEGDTVVEATSGNTGISFSAICSFFGNPVKIFMPNWMSEERKKLITSFGAEIVLVSKEEGGFLGSISRAEEMGKLPNVFLPRQFSNDANTLCHYEMTAPEILSQLSKNNITPNAVVAGVGTGGTIMGIGRYLKEKTGAKFYPLEPSNSPTLSTGFKVGIHRIQGISDEFIPDLVKLKEADGVISIDDGDAIIMAQRLSCELGLGVGISSGANLLGAVAVGKKIGHDKAIVTVFADDNKKYLSTDYANAQPCESCHLSSDIELLGYEVIK